MHSHDERLFHKNGKDGEIKRERKRVRGEKRKTVGEAKHLYRGAIAKDRRLHGERGETGVGGKDTKSQAACSRLPPLSGVLLMNVLMQVDLSYRPH